MFVVCLSGLCCNRHYSPWFFDSQSRGYVTTWSEQLTETHNSVFLVNFLSAEFLDVKAGERQEIPSPTRKFVVCCPPT